MVFCLVLFVRNLHYEKPYNEEAKFVVSEEYKTNSERPVFQLASSFHSIPLKPSIRFVVIGYITGENDFLEHLLRCPSLMLAWVIHMSVPFVI